MLAHVVILGLRNHQTICTWPPHFIFCGSLWRGGKGRTWRPTFWSGSQDRTLWVQNLLDLPVSLGGKTKALKMVHSPACQVPETAPVIPSSPSPATLAPLLSSSGRHARVSGPLHGCPIAMGAAAEDSGMCPYHPLSCCIIYLFIVFSNHCLSPFFLSPQKNPNVYSCAYRLSAQ